MRLNLPVTQREHRLPESATLVSTTDLKGRILHCNPSFVAASGYAREELIGQPHNLIRHPDMPAEAFRDMWATIAAGQPWQALVKNRRKDGDHYWVRANVTPVVDANGTPQGYMSVRTVPSRAEIERADALYATMREQAAAGRLRHVLRSGQVVRAGLPGRLAAALRWTIGMQLAIAGVAVGLGGVALAQVASLPVALAGGAGLGLLAGAFGRRIALLPLGEAVRVGNRLAAGDLSPLPPVTRDDEQGRLMKSLNQLAVNLHAIVGDVRQDVGRIQSAATEIAVGNQDLSSRTEAQASSLQQTAASMEEIAGTVRSSAEAAEQASTLSRQASEVAQRGGAAVQQVVDTMGAIAASSSRIGAITELIDSLSFQTNILALNAAVEAARAGEHGRSFAVVAGEVRQLAQRSADASREIRSLIDASREQVAQGGTLADGARRTMDEIQTAIARADSFIGEVSHAAHEQTGGIRQINEAVTHIDSLTQQNAAMVEQLAAAAQGLREQSELVSASVGVFRLRD